MPAGRVSREEVSGAVTDAPRVLVVEGSSGQNRSALGVVRALSGAGLAPSVAVSGRRSLAASSRHAARVLRVPPVDDPSFREVVARVETEGSFAARILASDAAILALGAPGSDLVDKSHLAERAAEAAIPVPVGRRFANGEEVLAVADTFVHPVIVKSAVKHRSVVVQPRVVRGPGELSASVRHASGPVIVQPFIDQPLRAVSGVVHAGRVIAWVHQRYVRTWPREAGVSCMAVTQDPDEELEERLVRLLSGYDGIFQAQFAGDHLLDVNPRAYGSVPLAVAAGVNLPALHCRAAMGYENRRVQRARVGVRYRWVEGDVRHVFAAVRDGDVDAGHVWTALRPRRGTVHSVVSLTDPLPALTRLAYVCSELARSVIRRG